MTKIAFEMNSAQVVTAEIAIDWDKLAKHPAVLEYIIRHGVKQMLGDAYSTFKGTDDAKKGQALKKLDALYAGQVAQSREGGGDPVKRLMKEMALTEIKDAAKKVGKKIGDIAKDKLAAAVEAHMVKNDERLRKAAVKVLAIKPAASEDEIDLDDLFGDASE